MNILTKAIILVVIWFGSITSIFWFPDNLKNWIPLYVLITSAIGLILSAIYLFQEEEEE